MGIKNGFVLVWLFWVTMVFSAEKPIREPLRVSYSVTNAAFAHSLGSLLGPPLTPDNRIQALLNGDEVFPAMLQAIGEARQSITFEAYIWNPGRISDLFVEALCQRARAGVKVHVILDGVGSRRFKGAPLERLQQAGIEVTRYNPPRWWHWISFWRLNHRTHRKLTMIDGRIGFNGGLCIDDLWAGNGRTPDHWRDTHFRLEGPVVAQMQGVFMDNWVQTEHEVLHGPDYFPVPQRAGQSLAQCFKSGPVDGAEAARLVYLYSIAAARSHIRLSHAYFVPDDLAMQAILEARRRGVEVEIIIPHKSDSFNVRKGGRPLWEELVEAGVKIYEFQPALYHCKVMVVDTAWVTFGSVNFDSRSFRINDECNINVLDPVFAAEQIRIFEEDKARSQALTLEQLKRRPWYKKTTDAMFSILRPQL